MTDIAKCALCKSKAAYAAHSSKYWYCSNITCGCKGPIDDANGTGWNRLMRGDAPADAEPKPGAVRVRIPVEMRQDGAMRVDWYRAKDGCETKSNLPNSVVAYITADVPIPKVAEITGIVEQPKCPTQR